MAKITTYGTGAQFVTSALMGYGATDQDPNGRFYLDGSAVNVDIANVIAESIYIKRIFRDGQSVTGKYTSNAKRGGAVRVLLNTPLPFSSRTTSFGGRPGTPGNSGVINVNPAQLPADDEFLVYLTQVNDQMLAFPELGKEYIPLDVMAPKIAQYADRVGMDRDASTLAEIIAYAFYRSLNSGDNLVAATDMTAKNAYANLLNTLNTKLDNGDSLRGAYTFPTEGRTIIGRPDFINGLFSTESGVIVMGGDLAQEMLRSYDLDADMNSRGYVGTGYKGHAMQFHFQSAPDYIWNLAEAYLDLPKGSLAKVKAIAVSFDATASAEGIDLGMKLVDATQFRGSLAQPLNIWGHEAFRKSFVVASSDFTNTTISSLGFSESTKKAVIAPEDAATRLNEGASQYITVPVYDEDGTVVGYKRVLSVPTPNGGNIGA